MSHPTDVWPTPATPAASRGGYDLAIDTTGRLVRLEVRVDGVLYACLGKVTDTVADLCDRLEVTIAATSPEEHQRRAELAAQPGRMFMLDAAGQKVLVGTFELNPVSGVREFVPVAA